MQNAREIWYDAANKVQVTLVDVTEAAQTLARGHLAGPTSTYFLTKALAAAALLASETGEKDESVIIQMKCEGPLGGFNVECTADGKLRGYTEKKVLDDFDGLGLPDPKKVIGPRQIQVTRSVPGRIISQGIATSLDGYLAGSLQRKACMYLEAAVTDDVEVKVARGLMVESLPDSTWSIATADAVFGPHAKPRASLAVASRNLLAKLGLSPELKSTAPLAFGCRCSPDRARAALAALSPEERKTLPPQIAVTCHMCGRTFTIEGGQS